jgi:hypothetical protein
MSAVIDTLTPDPRGAGAAVSEQHINLKEAK